MVRSVNQNPQSRSSSANRFRDQIGFKLEQVSYGDLRDTLNSRMFLLCDPLRDIACRVTRPCAAGIVPQTFGHHMMAQEPIVVEEVGCLSRTPPISQQRPIAAALVNVEPGAVRERRWQPHDEWQYNISGRGRMTVFARGGKARTFNYQAGDVGYIPFAMAHYVQSLRDQTPRYRRCSAALAFVDVSLNQWMTLTPPELLRAYLNPDPQTMAALYKDKPIIVAGPR
jgi:oxalate decarboxylase